MSSCVKPFDTVHQHDDGTQKLEEDCLREWDQEIIGTISQTEETEHAR